MIYYLFTEKLQWDRMSSGQRASKWKQQEKPLRSGAKEMWKKIPWMTMTAKCAGIFLPNPLLMTARGQTKRCTYANGWHCYGTNVPQVKAIPSLLPPLAQLYSYWVTNMFLLWLWLFTVWLISLFWGFPACSWGALMQFSPVAYQFRSFFNYIFCRLLASSVNCWFDG